MHEPNVVMAYAKAIWFITKDRATVFLPEPGFTSTAIVVSSNAGQIV